MGESRMLRFGQFIPTDEVRDAWVSGDLERMLRAASLQTNLGRPPLPPIRNREGDVQASAQSQELAALCAQYSEQHLAEFQTIAPALKADMARPSSCADLPVLRRRLLAEQGDFERAIWVCELAKYYGLEDGTKAGFDGRMARIRREAGSVTYLASAST